MKRVLPVVSKRGPLVLLTLALLIGACNKGTPTRPDPPAQTSGSGILLYRAPADTVTWEIYSIAQDGLGVVRLTNDRLLDWQPRWSPDGKRIAFIRGYPATGYPTVRLNLTVMDWDGANPVRLTDDLGDDSPSWSPDGSKISFIRTTNLYPELWTINADGTAPTLVADSLDVWEVSWTPQGTFIGMDYFGMVQFNEDGSGRTRILNLQPNGSYPYQCYPRMSPDGTRIAFQWFGPNRGDTYIYVVKSDGTNLQRVTDPGATKWPPVWSPDGSRIAFSWGASTYIAIFTINPDGSNLEMVSPGPSDDYVGDWR
jgi:TolB protein